MVEENAGRLAIELEHDWATDEETYGYHDITFWEPPTQDPSDTRALPTPLWLLNNQRREVAIHPTADLAVATFDRALARLLPGFVTDDYDVHVALQPAAAIIGGATVAIQLARRDTYQFVEQGMSYDNEWPLTFDLRDAPSGFQLWIQLALLELSARATEFAASLTGTLRAAMDIFKEEVIEPTSPDQYITSEELREQMLTTDRPEPEPEAAPSEPHWKLVAIKQTLQAVLQALPDSGQQPFQRSITQLLDVLAQTQPPQETDPSIHSLTMIDEIPPAPSFFASRFYLIDEPEQRVHPALQRRAARWLASAMDSWNAQALIATHSLPFIDLPDNVVVHELSRNGENSDIARLDIADLTVEAQPIRQLGLDRGELLTRANAFLFTDTPQLADIIDGLTRSRLRQAGIEVRALEPGRAGHGLAQLELLCQITATPIIVLLTSLPEQQIEALGHADADQRAQAVRCGADLAIAASLTELQVHRERTIHTVSLEAVDVMDLLDDQTIAEHCRPGHSPFPGLTAARADFRDHRHRDQPTFSAFLLERYGLVTDPINLRDIARTMELFDRPSPRLGPARKATRDDDRACAERHPCDR